MTLPTKTWQEIFDNLIQQDTNAVLTWDQFAKNNNISISTPKSELSEALEKEQMAQIKTLEGMIKLYTVPYAWQDGVKQKITEIFSKLNKLHP